MFYISHKVLDHVYTMICLQCLFTRCSPYTIKDIARVNLISSDYKSGMTGTRISVEMG